MERASKALLRPLGVKNTNVINNNVTNEKLSNKKLIDQQQSRILNFEDDDNSKENLIPYDFDRSRNGTSQQVLTAENLQQLQNEIIELESVLFPCGHLLCGQENRLQVKSLRLWLLFELEMSPDNGVTNLRNSCYHDHVYEGVCSPWKVQNCLQEKIPQDSDFEPFPLQQLIIPEIELTKESIQIVDPPQRKKIPPTSLSSQNRQKIFDSNLIDTTAIVRHRRVSETSDDEQAPDEEDQEASRRFRKRHRGISTLEKKLALIGGISPSKLTK